MVPLVSDLSKRWLWLWWSPVILLQEGIATSLYTSGSRLLNNYWVIKFDNDSDDYDYDDADDENTKVTKGWLHHAVSLPSPLPHNHYPHHHPFDNHPHSFVTLITYYHQLQKVDSSPYINNLNALITVTVRINQPAGVWPPNTPFR